jgi:TonB family protein
MMLFAGVAGLGAVSTLAKAGAQPAVAPTPVPPPAPPAPPAPAPPPPFLAGSGPAPARIRSGFIRTDDYPARAIRAGAQGRVLVKILIGRDGAVRECDIERSSGSIDLDWASCRLVLQRFQYDPARNAEGWAQEETMTRTIGWVLPGEAGTGLPSPSAGLRPGVRIDPAHPPDRPVRPVMNRIARLGPEDYPPEALRAGAEGVVTVRLNVGPLGRPLACAVASSSGNAALDAGTCALAVRRFHYRPAESHYGVWLTVPHEERIEWRLGRAGEAPRVALLTPNILPPAPPPPPPLPPRP